MALAKKTQDNRRVIALDMDDVLVIEPILECVMRDFGIVCDQALQTYDLKWLPEDARLEVKRRFADPEYNRNPKIISGAEETVARLASAGYRLVVVTARSEDIRGVTEDTLSRFFPSVRELHMTGGGSKGAICRGLGARWLFDDALHNIESAIQAGVEGVLVSSAHTHWNHSERQREDISVISGISQAWSVVERDDG